MPNSGGIQTVRVDLPVRDHLVRIGERETVPLATLWDMARLGVSAAALAFDFVGADGFRLGAKSPAGVPGTELPTGYLCLGSCDLVWQPTPTRPCFWRVKGVRRIVATASVRAATAFRASSRATLPGS